MKAKEYFAKYEDRLHSDDNNAVTQGVYDMLLEMANESKATLDARRAQSNHALVGVLSEFNDKWNAIQTMDEKKYGFSYIKRNGFKEFWLHEVTGLCTIWK